VLPVAAAELLLLAATANRYGYHRDELYFRVAARHPAWGYDDQPALTPMLGRFSEWAFGPDPRGLRIVSAIAMAIVVTVVALIARELGAGRAGQIVAAASTGAAAGLMAVGHLLSTTTFDLLAWLVAIWLVARILGGGDERLWLAVGLVAGIALENKHLILLLFVSLAGGMLLAGRARLARSPWLAAGVALAGVLWLPNVLWQAHHGWPQLELGRKIAGEDPIGYRLQLLPFQLLLTGPLLAPLWIAGLVWLVRSREARPYRAIGFAYLILLGLAFVTAAKPYYTMGLLFALLGAGGVVAERGLAEGRRRRWPLGAAIVFSAVIAAALTLPFVPVADVHATPIPAVDEDAVETIGWPSFANTVAAAWRRIPEPERQRAVIYAGNYGEAGALARYGPSLSLPHAYSGHNAFWRFGRPPDGAAAVIVVGHRNPAGNFDGCVRAARIDNGVEIDNEEQGGAVWLCRGPSRPWSQLWGSLRHLDP
jgi:4-amino-4-deoxy-L-arabinose transferase-like glycosyltransferase